MSNAMVAGSVAVEIHGDDKDFQDAIKQCENSLEEFDQKAGELNQFKGVLQQTVISPLKSVPLFFGAAGESANVFSKVVSGAMAAATKTQAFNNIALALSTKGITAAVHELSVAIYAIPGWGWALAGVAAIAAIAYAISNMNKETIEVTDNFKKLIEEKKRLQEDPDQQKNKLKSEIGVDLLKRDTLKALSEAETLTEEEFEKAKKLVEDLERKYGDLGFRIDKATRSIFMVDGADPELEQTAGNRLASSIENKIRNLQKSADALEKQKADIDGKLNNGSRALSNQWFRNDTFYSKGLINEKKRINEQLRLWEEEKKALQAQADAMRTGDIDNIQDLTESERLNKLKSGVSDRLKEEQKNEQEYAKQLEDERRAGLELEKQILSIDEKISRERKTQLENELDDIDKLNREYKELLETRYKLEKSKGFEADRNLMKELEIRFNSADATAADRKQRAIDRATSNLSISDGDLAIGKANSSVAKATLELDAANATGDAERIKVATEELEKAKQDLIDTTYQQAVIDLGKAHSDLEAAQDRYDKAMKVGDRVQIAEADRVLSEAMAELGAKQSRYDAALDMQHRDLDGLADNRSNSLGTFSAYGAAALGGDIEEKQLKEMQIIAANTAETNRKIEDMGMTFG